MLLRRAVVTLAAAGIVGVAAFSSAGAQPIYAATPMLTVTVYCRTNPEKVVVRNNRSVPVTIAKVGSIYQPYSNEPFRVNYRLGARRTVTFYTGNGATYSNPRTLTRRYIFNNSVGTREGARVTHVSGTSYTDRC